VWNCPLKPRVSHSFSAFRSGTSAPFLGKNKYIFGRFGITVGKIDKPGAAVLPNDRWRSARDVFKHQINLDAKFVGVEVKKEVYGMYARFFSPSGREAYGSLNQEAKQRHTIIPDLVKSYHPYDSILQANGPQMWELKRAQSVQAFSHDSGLPDGLNGFYRLRNRGCMVRAADRRADLVPSECDAKAKRADEAFGAPGSTAALEALRAIPKVQGIALGALGESSESINLLIQGLAHKGALKNPDRFGQSNYKASSEQIHWWLKRRWARLEVITAIETRNAGLGYAGGSSQQQAAAFHAHAQAQGDWREDGAYRQREEETAAPFFGGFGGA
jgi:hypothetical protein